LWQPAQPIRIPEHKPNQENSKPHSLQEDVVYKGLGTTTNREKNNAEIEREKAMLKARFMRLERQAQLSG
jgi:hypothetical protein